MNIEVLISSHKLVTLKYLASSIPYLTIYQKSPSFFLLPSTQTPRRTPIYPPHYGRHLVGCCISPRFRVVGTPNNPHPHPQKSFALFSPPSQCNNTHFAHCMFIVKKHHNRTPPVSISVHLSIITLLTTIIHTIHSLHSTLSFLLSPLLLSPLSSFFS